MKLSTKQSDAFAKIIKRGMSHYKTVPHSLGHFDTVNDQKIIGYVVWRDADAHFTTEKGDTNQEFYINEAGVVCVYIDKVFIPVNFRAKNWKSFCNPKNVGSESES